VGWGSGAAHPESTTHLSSVTFCIVFFVDFHPSHYPNAIVITCLECRNRISIEVCLVFASFLACLLACASPIHKKKNKGVNDKRPFRCSQCIWKTNVGDINNFLDALYLSSVSIACGFSPLSLHHITRSNLLSPKDAIACKQQLLQETIGERGR